MFDNPISEKESLLNDRTSFNYNLDLTNILDEKQTIIM